MKPDKIYLGLEDVGSGYTWNISILDNGMEQYIRKSALLGWAEKELEKLYELIPDAHKVEDEIATPMEMRYLGQYMQMESVIDKLNSL